MLVLCNIDTNKNHFFLPPAFYFTVLLRATPLCYVTSFYISLEDDPEGCEEQPDILGSLYDEAQQWIMENYPDSYAAQTYIAAAEELVNGTDAQSGENG